MMIIDIDGVKKTNPGKDAARGTAEIPEENIPDTAPDGLKQDETATVFKKMVDGLYKSRFRSETVLRRIKEKKGGENNP